MKYLALFLFVLVSSVNADEELANSQQFYEELFAKTQQFYEDDFEAFKKLSIHLCKKDTFPHYMTEKEKSYICVRAFDFNLKTTKILFEINRPKEAEEELLNTILYSVNSCNLHRISEDHDKFCEDNYEKYQRECKNCGNKCAKPSYCQIVEKQRSTTEQHMFEEYWEASKPFREQLFQEYYNKYEKNKEQPQK